MFGFLSFLIGAQFWSNLASSLVAAIPHLTALASTVAIAVWNFLTWYLVKFWEGVVQTWKTPIVIACMIPFLVLGTYSGYRYGKEITSQRVIDNLREDYRFVPRKKSGYQFKMPTPYIWRWF